jgi:hypothetical protein
MSIINYNKLNKAEKEIVNGWRQACQDRDLALRDNLRFKWYHFFNYNLIKKNQDQLNDAWKRWDIFWNLMIASKII